MFSATIAVDSTPLELSEVLVLAWRADTAGGPEAGGPLLAALEGWPKEHDAVNARGISTVRSTLAYVLGVLLAAGGIVGTWRIVGTWLI